jgi:SAM-dependent methyltransferase
MSNSLLNLKIVKKQNKSYNRLVEGNRLIYYEATADEAFWDRHWQENFSDKLYDRAERGILDKFEPFFTRYLPKSDPILEAGCGLGQYVLALGVRGYTVEGVEWGSKTVAIAQKHYPDLPVRLGDVTKLDVQDGYYGAYISLGVWEHRREGPEPFVNEAFRVLKSSGIGLISVPYFNPLRRIKARMGLYQDMVEGLDFYQFAYSKEEFIRFLEKGGFNVIDYAILSPYKGITDEIPLLRWMAEWQPLRLLIQGVFSLPIFRKFGHSILFVCRKTER